MDVKLQKREHGACHLSHHCLGEYLRCARTGLGWVGSCEQPFLALYSDSYALETTQILLRHVPCSSPPSKYGVAVPTSTQSPAVGPTTYNTGVSEKRLRRRAPAVRVSVLQI